MYIHNIYIHIVCVYINIYMYIYIYIYICIYIHKYLYINAYPQTHLYIYLPSRSTHKTVELEIKIMELENALEKALDNAMAAYENFSKVSSLPNLLCKMTIELSFEYFSVGPLTV